MNLLTKASVIWQVVWWRILWDKHDSHYPVPKKCRHNPKFMTPWDATGLIPDGAVMATSGLGGNQTCQTMYWAIKERFQQEGHPKGLTVISVGGQGGRGKIPGSLEELGVAGLTTRMFTGHAETFKALLKLADAGQLELQIIPQGTLTLLLKAQAEGREYVENDTGKGTFIDPRTGRGTPLVPPDAPQWVEVTPEGRFRWRIPRIDTAVFSAPAADPQGNIYMKNHSVLAESWEIAKAARRNGGSVIVNVGLIVDEGYDRVFLSADEVDAVVYWPRTYQVITIPHKRYWKCLTLDSDLPVEEGLARVKIVKDLLGVTPKRNPVDSDLARIAARVFMDNARPGDYVDIGVGLPEEVSRVLSETGAMKQITMVNESGVFGGMAAPGVFFGAAVNPKEIVSSATAFERIYQRLDWSILGALEIDAWGNVNVSKRGEGAINYVGPGGFIDLTRNSKYLIFCTAWGEKAQIEMGDGSIRIKDHGKPKFVEQVAEITFNGTEALREGKKVFYVTHIGAFRLTDRGMELFLVVPGVDVERDIRPNCPMPFVLPESGAPEVVGPEVVTGQGFTCRFQNA